MSEPMITTSGLCKSYEKGSVRVLDGVDLQIDRGEFVTLAGASGCGKSTLLHLLAALDRPTSGSIVVDGKDLARLRQVNRYRRSTIGLIFQFHNLLPQLEAQRNVELAMLGTARSSRERTERAAELLGQLGLATMADRPPTKLSGGERVRVAIARALANDPVLLLADEPTGGLDQESMTSVLSLFAELRRERGLTVLMVSHDPRVMAQSDRRLVLRDGRLVQ